MSLLEKFISLLLMHTLGSNLTCPKKMYVVIYAINSTSAEKNREKKTPAS